MLAARSPKGEKATFWATGSELTIESSCLESPNLQAVRLEDAVLVVEHDLLGEPLFQFGADLHTSRPAVDVDVG